jgi:hypothetical protein
MSAADEVRRLFPRCTPEERRQLFDELRNEFQLHPLETVMNVKAEAILEALHRAPELTMRMFRGILGDAVFAATVAPRLAGWTDVTPPGNHAYDTALADSTATVRVQTKMQRRLKGEPFIRQAKGIVEVQRTRTGTKQGQATRPYRFGEFDILAVCMEPSHGSWESFLYIPERWLLPRAADPNLIDILQPVSLRPDALWTDDFDEGVQRLRSNLPRPIDPTPLNLF